MGSFRRGVTRIVAAIAMLLVSACYEVGREVIPASAGVQIPEAISPITWNNGGSVQFSFVPATRDYRFSERSADGSVHNGSVRAMPVRDNIYALQVLYDGSRNYEIYFLQVTATRVEWMSPQGNLVELGRRYAVNFTEPENDEQWDMNRLEGNPANLLAFLRAHRELRFEKSD
ncbi:MAG: hypothetical protein FJX65_10360 [Alphaproteobacteria bacterium]|nr:hypothetical protein [Alphaproteobacteria bacterium]